MILVVLVMPLALSVSFFEYMKTPSGGNIDNEISELVQKHRSPVIGYRGNRDYQQYKESI